MHPTLQKSEVFARICKLSTDNSTAFKEVRSLLQWRSSVLFYTKAAWQSSAPRKFLSKLIFCRASILLSVTLFYLKPVFVSLKHRVATLNLNIIVGYFILCLFSYCHMEEFSTMNLYSTICNFILSILDRNFSTWWYPNPGNHSFDDSYSWTETSISSVNSLKKKRNPVIPQNSFRCKYKQTIVLPTRKFKQKWYRTSISVIKAQLVLIFFVL